MNAVEVDIVGTIYVITNLINGKKYVGLTTKDPSVRYLEHVYQSRRGSCCYAIHKAIRKHGIENFRLDVLQTCKTKQELLNAEIRWIDELQTQCKDGCGYNMTAGGDGIRDYVPTIEHRQRLSRAMKGRTRSPEHCAAIAIAKLGDKNPMHGKKLSEEHRSKISKSNKGKRRSDEARKKISAGLTGKSQTSLQKTARKVVAIDVTDGKDVITFLSVWDAARSFGENASASNILYCCHGRRKTAYGYRWKFWSSEMQTDNHTSR